VKSEDCCYNLRPHIPSHSARHSSIFNCIPSSVSTISLKGGEDDDNDEHLATLRTQLEKEILEGSCGALKGSGFTPNIAEVIMDEITLLIHLKVQCSVYLILSYLILSYLILSYLRHRTVPCVVLHW
jgi:hypothetical protein